MSISFEILIVDDDALLCERLEALLAAHHIRAISVDSLALAREAMRAVYFPVVILDRRLADGDGFELCREYRARQSGKRVRILMLSASDSVDDYDRAIASGADDFLGKGCSDAELIAHVKQLCAATSSTKSAAKVAGDERARLQALAEFEILDTPPEPAYDDITRLAAIICKVPTALVSLIDGKRQWFKSKFGFNAPETPLEYSFCKHALATPNEVLVVADAREDARFAQHPSVVGEPYVRFYAGAPLVTAEGHVLGTLCVFSKEARTLDDVALEGLRALSRQIMLLLEQRRDRKSLELALVAERAADSDLRRSEITFREAYENAPIGIALVSITGEWLKINRPICDMLGYAPDEMLRTTFQSITHPEDLDSDLSHVRQVLDGSIHSYQMEKRYIHKRGHTVWVQLNVSLVRDEHDTPQFFISHIQDITRRKLLEAAAAASALMRTSSAL